MDNKKSDTDKKLSAKEVLIQTFSLLFQIGDKKNVERAADQFEHNPRRIIIAGIIGAILFFTVCFTAMKLVLANLT